MTTWFFFRKITKLQLKQNLPTTNSFVNELNISKSYIYLSLADGVIRETIAARWRRAAPRRRVTVGVKVGKHHPVKCREAKAIQY